MQKILFFSILCLINLAQSDRVNAFTVQLFKSTGEIDNLADADAVIGGTNLDSIHSGNYDVVDFRDVAYGTPWGNSPIDNFFPGTTGFPNINDYAVLVTTTIEITTADDWTFLTNADDGVRLRIKEIDAIDFTDVIVDDTVHPTQDRLGEINLTAGNYDLEVVVFDIGGVGALELWAAQGSHSAYNSTDFQLIGDVANGGIAANVPLEFQPTLGILFSIGLISFRHSIKKRH